MISRVEVSRRAKALAKITKKVGWWGVYQWVNNDTRWHIAQQQKVDTSTFLSLCDLSEIKQVTINRMKELIHTFESEIKQRNQRTMKDRRNKERKNKEKKCILFNHQIYIKIAKSICNKSMNFSSCDAFKIYESKHHICVTKKQRSEIITRFKENDICIDSGFKGNDLHLLIKNENEQIHIAKFELNSRSNMKRKFDQLEINNQQIPYKKQKFSNKGNDLQLSFNEDKDITILNKKRCNICTFDNNIHMIFCEICNSLL